jgi:putative flippase GtrA
MPIKFGQFRLLIIGQIAAPELSRFLLVGFTNFLVSFLMFNAGMLWLPKIVFRTAICQLMSYSTGIAWSFILNRKLTFRSKAPWARQAAKFIGLQIALAVVSAWGISMGVDSFHLNSNLTWFGVMSVVTIVNFVMAKVWVFSSDG